MNIVQIEENLDIPLEGLPKHYDFFQPWAGMEKAEHQNENPADVRAAERMAKLFDEIKKDNPDEFGEGQLSDFEGVLLDKLPEVLDIDQKKNKVKNILQSLRRQGKIETEGKVWKMSKN